MNARERQLDIFRRMTPQERLSVATRLYWSARAIKAAYLRQQHPSWSEDAVLAEVKRIFLHART